MLTYEWVVAAIIKQALHRQRERAYQNMKINKQRSESSEYQHNSFFEYYNYR